MEPDVKLDQGDGTSLYLEGRVVKARTSDFMLEAPERRKRATPHRRALVHDHDDGLTVNYAQDYPGGLTLNGVVRIVPLDSPGTSNPQHAFGTSRIPTLVVDGDISYQVPGVTASDVAVPGKSVKRTGRVTVSLSEELGRLNFQLSELAAKLATLEARVK
jgi:hypothetical protein